MPRLTWRVPGAARRDRGGVATIVAVLLAGGVLLGMTALVVDVGQLMVEREELQSGADAAAYEVALDCVKNRPACALGSVDTVADGYGDKNAKDGHAAIIDVCGAAQNRLPACAPAPADNLTDCIGTVPAGVSYVEVRTKTEITNGTTLLPPTFAQAIVPGYSGATVGACARVGWGPPAGGLAFTFSKCEWDAFTSNGTVLAPEPPATVAASFEHAIVLHDPDAKKTPTCPAGPSGGDLPGGFGWTDEDGVPCHVTIDADGHYGADPGSSGHQCDDALENAYNSGEPQLVPVFGDHLGTGQNGEYVLHGVAAFVVTGYRLPGLSEPAKLHGAHLCNGSDFCIYGYFTKALVSGGSIGTGPNLGATVIKTIG